MNRSLRAALTLVWLGGLGGLGVAAAQPGGAPGGTRGSAAAPAASEPRKADEFRPSLHGFAFVNSFTGSPLPASLRAIKGPIGELLRDGIESGTGAPNHFGLCGGMSLAAADLFMERKARPGATRPPEPGTAMYEWLHQRQESSLGTGGLMALKFMTWMALPDPAPAKDERGVRTIAHATFEEIGPVLRRLEKGELVPLGLVYVRSSSNASAPASEAGLPWENHQVLAYRARRPESDAGVAPSSEVPEKGGPKDAEAPPAAGQVTIWIYDPNYPGDDEARIVLDITSDQARAVQVTGAGRRRRVRGVMGMPWSAKPVPAEIAGGEGAEPARTAR